MTKEKLCCFVMMKFGAVEEPVFLKALQQSFSQFKDFDIVLSRADMRDTTSPDLKDQVFGMIAKCDFAIADLSTENHNVFLEIGYATALDKPVILLFTDNRQIPSDLASRYMCKYDSASLDMLPIKIAPFLRGANEQIIASQRTLIFPVEGYARRNLIDLKRIIADAKRDVRLLTTNLEYFVGRGGDNLMRVLARTLDAKPELEVRILTLDPDSNFTNDRALQLGRPKSTYRELLRRSLESASQILNGFPDRCQIQTYDEFPTQVTLIVDEKIISSVISRNMTGRQTCNFLLNRNNFGAEQSFVSHFEAVWSKGTSFRRKMGLDVNLPRENTAASIDLPPV